VVLSQLSTVLSLAVLADGRLALRACQLAAEMTGRVCHAIEIAPAYVDVAVR